MKFYKIRRKSDGLFSTGGVDPFWKKHGKSWTTFAHLKGHLATRAAHKKYYNPELHEIVMYTVAVTATLTFPESTI